MKKTVRFQLTLMLGLLFSAKVLMGQTYYQMSSGNYLQTFTSWSGYATNWNGVPVNAVGSVPSATKTTTTSVTTLGTVGTSSAIGYDAATSSQLVFLQAGATDNSDAIACDLNLDFTGRTAGNISFDYSLIFNTSVAAGRASTLGVYYSIDNSSWTSLGAYTVYNTTGNSTTATNVSISLPSAISYQSNVKIRFYCYNGGAVIGSPSGSRPKIGLDNVLVTSNAITCGTYSGTLTVGPSSANFPNLTTAFGQLAACGYSGNIILELQAGYVSSSETFPLTINSGLGSNSTKTITIRPAIAATGLNITSSSSTATIDFKGCNYIFLDGRPGGAGTTSQLSIGNTGAAPAVRFINDAANNTVKYVTVSSTVTSTTSGLIAFSTTTGANGNDNNTIDNCDLNGAGTAANIIYALGTTTSATTNNSGVIISNNKIHDQFVATTATNGILISSGNTDWTIQNNSFYQSSTRTFTTAATHTAINISNTSGVNFLISGNYIGGSSINCGGTAWTISGTVANLFQGILISAGTATASSIQGNTISNLSFLTSSSASALPGVWEGIYISSGAVNVGTVSGNTIGASTGTGSISSTTSTAGGVSVGIGNASLSTVVISNNTIGAINIMGSSTTIAHSFYGIWNSAASTSITISSNTIGSTTTANSINSSTANTVNTTGQVVYGIYNSGNSSAISISSNTIANLNNAFAPTTAYGTTVLSGISSINGVNTINGNIIRNLSTAALATGMTQDASVMGIHMKNTTTGNQVISQNTIYSLTNSNPTTAAGTYVVGINYYVATNSSNLIDRNFIYDLVDLSSNSLNACTFGMIVWGGNTTVSNNMIRIGGGMNNNINDIRGILDWSTGGANYYHNSVYIDGAPTTGATSSFAFYSDATTTRNIKNNIFVNGRSNNGSTGKHYAIYLYSNTTLTSNNNDFYVSGTGGVLGKYSSDKSTLAAWQTAIGQDANSFNVNPNFIDPTATTPNLHINTSMASALEANGSTGTGVTLDIDGETRANLTPVDIGADAGVFLAATPQISLTSVSPTTITQCSATNRLVTVSVTTPIGTISSVILNYSHNGAAQAAVTMTNTSGSTYTGTMLAPTTSNATVTWNVTATNSSGFSYTFNGTSFSDNPNVGVTATATATASTCSTNLAVNVSKPGTITIGTGTSLTSATSYPTAFENYYYQNWQQFLFTASELQALGLAAGNITAMSLNVGVLPNPNTALTDYTVKIVSTNSTALSTLTVNGFTTVYGPSTVTAATGWNTITFATPYNWDGTSNIIIDVRQTGHYGSGNATTYYTTTSNNSVLYAYSSSSNTSFWSSSPTPSISTSRPNMKFSGNTISASAYAWSPTTSLSSSTISNPVANPTSTTSYSCSATVNGCPLVSNSVSVSAITLPSAPTVSNSNQCGTGTPTCSVSGSTNGNYRWYTVATGGSAITGQTNSTLSNYPVSTTTTFYVSIWNGTCESIRTAVTVSVSQADVLTASSGSSTIACLGNSTTLSVSQSGSTNTYVLNWTSTSGSGLTGSTSTTLNSPLTITPTSAGTFVYTVTGTESSTGCQSIATVSVLVNNPNANVVATASANNPNVCSGSPTSLSLSISGSGTAILGAGANTSSAAGQSFLPGSWGGAKTQYLFKASELLAQGLVAGNITTIGFEPTTSGQTYTGFQLWLNTTASTSMTTTFLNNGTQVYLATATNNAFTPVANSLNTLTFGTGVGSSSSFYWDGVSNLVLTFSWSSVPSASTSTSSAMKVDALSFICTSYDQTDSQTPAAELAMTTADGTSSNRAKLTFGGTVNTLSASTYSWSNGTSVVGITNPLVQSPTSSTSYSCTATINSCPVVSNTVSVSTILLPTAPTATNSSQCGAGTPTCSVSGSSNGNYRWYNVQTGGTALSGQNNSTLSNYSVSASTTFYVSIWNGTCESNRTAVTVTVTQPDAIVAAASNTNLTCLGNSTSLSVSQANTNNTYSLTWSSTTGSGLTNGTTTSLNSTVAVTPTVAGTYVYTITGSEASTGCQATSTVSVVVNNPVATVSATASVNNPTICNGNSVNLSLNLTRPDVSVGSGASTIVNTYANPFYSNWNNNKTQVLYLASELQSAGLTAGNLSALVMSLTAGNVSSREGLTISIGTTNATSLSTTFLTPTFTQVYYSTGYVPIIGSNTFTFGTGVGSTSSFTWDGSSNLVIQFCWDVIASTATRNSTCVSDNTSFASVVSYNRTSTTGTSICSGTFVGSATYTTRPRFTFVSSPVASQLSWSNGVSVVGSTASLSQSPSSTTTYTCTATVSSCPVSSNAVNVTVNPLPTVVASAASSNICQSSSTTLSATGAVTYAWSPATNLSSTTGSPTFTSSTSGNVTYTVTGTDANACSNTAQVTVTVIAPPAAVSVTGTSPSCNNTTLTASGGAGGSIYFQGTTSNGNATSIMSSSETVSSSGTYYFRSYDGTCFGAQGSLAVVINTQPVITQDPSNLGETICQNVANFTPLTVVATGSNLTYQWYENTTASNSNGISISGATTASYTPMNTIAGTKYFYCVVSSSSCPSTTSAVSGPLTVTAGPSAPTVDYSSLTVNVGASATFTGQRSSASNTLTWWTSASGGTEIDPDNTTSVDSVFNSYLASILSNPSTSVAFCTPGLTAQTTTYKYYVQQSDGTCPSPRTEISVLTNNLFSNTPSNLLICQAGGTVDLVANIIPLANQSFQWMSSTTGSNYSNVSGATNASLNANPQVTTNYKLSMDLTPLGCLTPLTTSQVFAVGVLPPNNFAPSASPSAICVGETSTLSSNLSTGNFSVTSIPFAPSTQPNTGVTTLSTGGAATVPLSGGTLDDGGWGGIPIGFTYNFFGNNFTSLGVGTNGLVMFGAIPGYTTATGELGQYSFSSPTFPNSLNPGNIIGLMLSDMRFSTANGGNGVLKYWNDGIAPTRRFVLSGTYPQYSGGALTIVQLILYETTGIAEVHITSSASTISRSVGLQSAIPVPVATPTGAMAPGWNGRTTTLSTPESWRFTPGANYSYQWYLGSNLNTAIAGATSTSYTTTTGQSATSGQKTYTIAATNPTTQCASSQQIMITVNALPALPVSGGNVTACSNASSAILSATPPSSATVKWFDGSGNAVGTGNNLTVNPSTLVNGSTTYPLTLTYYAKSYSNTSCYSSGQGTAVNLVINEAPSAPSALQTAFTYCEGQSATQLAASAGAGNTLNWYTASLSSQPSSIAPTPNTSTNSGSPFAYYATQVSGVNGCESNSTSFTITVNNTPAAPAYVNGGNGNVSYCQGATTQAISSSLATLTGTNYYLYYTVSTGGTGTTTAIVPSSASAGTTTFYVSRMTVAGCEGARTPITVVINPSLTASVAISASSTTVCQNGSIDFTATPTNGGPSPTYAWFLNGTQVGTASTYSLANPLNGDAIYVNMVSNEPSCLFAANANSSTISLGSSSVTPSVSIVQSTGTTICAGTSVSYSVLNSMNMGSSPTYNWKVNGVTQSTTSTLTTTTLANNDVVTLVMTSSLSSSCLTSTSANSNAISMTVTPVTAFTNQPANTSVCLGASSSLSASAIGTGNISYQWQSSSTPTGTYNNITYVSNSTALSAGLTIPTVTSATSYRLVANSSCGSAISNVATISINQATAITQQPLTQTICEGSQVTFSVSALGTGSISYQWRKNGTAISGANAATYSISNLTSANAGQYSVVVSATCGSVTSSNAQLIVTPLTTISAQPTGVTVCEGNNVSLTVTATGTGNLTYQWYQNGTALTSSSATTDQFVTNGALNDAGSYTVVVTGTCSSVTSNAVNVVVNQNTAITTQPTAFTGCAFSPAALSVTAVGTNLGYQWNYAGAPITGANSSTYSISSPVTSNSGSYTVDVLGTCGNITSNSAVMTINGLPILSAIVGGNNGVCLGSSITLTNPTSNGLWSTNNNSIATINANGVLTGVSVGTVTVTYTYTNNLGCTNSVTKQIQVKGLPAVAIQTPLATTICQGESMSLTSSIAISYLWNNGATGQSILVNSTTPGTTNYSVTIVGANGCSAASSPIAISIIAVPSIAAITGSGNFPTYCLGSTGTLSNATPNGLWTTSNSNVISINASTGAISALTNGTATISYNVNNMSGCLYAYSATATAAITVTAPAAVVTANGSTTFCQGGNVGLSASSGTGYSYLWSNNATAQNVSATASGSYSVTVTAPNGCTSTSAPTFVTVLSNPNTTIIPAGPINICAGSSVTLSSGNALSYAWTNGANTPTITVNTAGNYGVTLTGANGCSATSNLTVVNVIQLPGTTIATSGPTSICNGSSVTLTGPTASSYLWSTGATTQSINATATGNYSLTASNGNCSTNATPVSVQLNPVPSSVITASGPTTFCAGGIVTLSAPTGSALTYQWSNGATTQSIVVTTSGSYTVTVSNAFNCSSTSTPSVVQVNALPSASITASGSTSICSGNSVNLSAAAANSYLWSNGSTTQTISVSNAGNYTVQTYSAQGCTATSIPTTVSILSLPTALVSQGSSTTFCQGGNVQLSASNASSYVWSNGATTQNILASSSGNYTVTVIGSNGCSATSTGITVSVLPAPTAYINPGTTIGICSGTSVTLSTNSATSYAWSTGATSPTIQVTTAGNYTVTLTGTNGCSATSPVTVVSIVASPTASITAVGGTTICQGSSTVLTASTSTSYLWNTGQTTQSIQVSLAGSYAVTVGSNGCSATSPSTFISYNPSPIATVSANGPTTFCQGNSVSLSAPSDNGNSYLWNTGATTQSINTSVAGNFNVVVTNGYGCSTTSNSSSVVVNPLPVMTPITGSNSICAGAQGQVTNAMTGGVYASSNLGVASIGQLNGQITGLTAGSTMITYLYTNSNGCSNSVTYPVTIIPAPVSSIVAGGPTTFCQGGNVTLTASPGTSYVWNTGATTSSIPVTTSGNYSVTITGSNGCSTTSINTNVNVLSPSPVSAINGANAVCVNGSISLTNQTSGGVWSSSNPSVATISSNGVVTGVSAGTSTISYSINSTNGCPNSVTKLVTVNAIPSTALSASSATTFCQGGSVQLNASPGVSYLWSNGATNASITVSTAGSYSVQVTSASGCISSSSVQQVSVLSNPTAVISSNGPTTICTGSTVTLMATPNASYLWSNNATTSSINVTSSGSYFVTVTNSSGCSTTSASTNITVNNLPSAVLTANGPTTVCSGNSVSLSVSNNPAYSYQWKLNGTVIPNALSNAYTASASGTYSVVVTNSSNCFVESNSISVVVNSTPVASISAGGSTTFCQGSSVILTAVNASSYQWSNGATSQSIVANTSGNYSVIVSNSNGCTAASNVLTVNVNSVPNATVSANGPTTICSGSNVVLTASPGASYLWNNGATTSSITVNTTGSYSVSVFNSNGCSNTSNSTVITVNSPSVASVSTSGSTTFCAGGSVNLTASNAVSYLWNTGQTTQAILVNTSGAYSVTLTNASGCTSTSAVTNVISYSAPVATITANGSTAICQGGSVQLNASPGVSYLWSNGATSSAINVTTAGNYTVQVTNSNGCVANSSVTSITVNANPIASISANGPLSICAGNNVVLTASPGASYLWSNGATSSSIVANVSANYTVQVTNAVGCSSTSSGTSVVVNAVPTPSITSQGSTTICQGSSVVLSTAATSGSTYQWKNNGTNIPLATAATYLTNAAGNYTVQVTNAAGCSATSNVTAVVVNSLPVASITNAGSNAICAGSSTVLTASSGSSYLWNNGATSAAISVSTAGSYSVNITNAAGCSNSASINITVLNPIVANISSSGPTTFCIGQSVVLTATPGSAYLWNTGATTSSISAANAGNYSVQLTGANGCVSTSSVVAISTISLPTSSISASGPTTFCQGSSVVLTASPGSSYLWSNGETSGSIVATNTGNYHVTVYNSAGCALTSQVVPVQVNSAPSATITANGSTGLCQGSSVVLTASPGSSYTWNTGESTASITVSNAGNYFATITNSNGCSSVSNVLPITVSIAPNATIQVQGSSTICQGSNVLLVTSGGANYSWTNGSTTASILVNSSGNYGVTVSNAQGCSVTLAPVSIVVNPSPVLSSISGNASVCVGANTVFSNNTPSGVWTSDNSAVASVNTSGLVTGVNAGSTLIHYAVTNSNGCSASVTKAIQVNANPVATISSSGSTTFCQGNNVTLTAPSGLTYQWMNGSSNQSITVSNSGVYSVQVYNANGCSTNSNSINVTVNPLPTVSISSPSNTLCLGSNLLLSASLSGANYIWNTGATSQQINVSTGGNYSVVITDQNGCSASSTTTITNGTPPQASISTSGPTSFCQGGSVILSGSGGNSYTWNNGSTSQNLTVTSTGVYSVMVTNANGCSSYSNPISVNVQQAPNASIVAYGPTTFCAGGSVNLACSGGGTYAWSNAATTQGISATTSGVYQLVITGSNGCTSTSNAINVTVLPVPTALITPSGSTTFCEGGSVDLVASGGTSYAWSNNQTTSTITAVSGGVYTVTVSNGACSNSISQLVTVNENPSSLIVASGLTTFCQGGQVSLTAQPGNTYLWSTNETTQTIVVNAAGTYGVSLQGVNGCTSNSNVLTVVVNQPTTSVVNATGLDSYTLNGILYTQSGTYTQTQTNVAGCDSTITLNLTLTVGLNEGKLTDVKIYPNPTSESFTILTEMPIFGAFAILDAQGKLVYSGEMNGLETQVNLSTVARGIYYIRIPELTEPLRVVKN